MAAKRPKGNKFAARKRQRSSDRAAKNRADLERQVRQARQLAGPVVITKMTDRQADQ